MWKMLVVAAVVGTLVTATPAPASLGVLASSSNASGTYGTLEGPTKIEVRLLPSPATEGAAIRELMSVPRRLPTNRLEKQGSRRAPEPTAFDQARSVGELRRAPPSVSSRAFEGLSANDNVISDVTPPDPQVAVGPNHVVEMVNHMGRIFNKSGGHLETFGLGEFFDVPNDNHFDPKIIFDAPSGRWFASYVSHFDRVIPSIADEGRLHLAVSSSDDPTATWNVYSFTDEGVFPDYAGIGITDDKLTISANVFDIDGPPGSISPGCDSSGYCGVATTVVQKSDLLAGDTADSFSFAIDPNRFTVRPAHNLSSGNDQFLTTWDMSTLDQLTVIRITGTPDAANVTEAAVTNLATNAQLSPPPSATGGIGSCVWGDVNLGPPPCIDSGDARMLEAVWRDNRLWSAASAACQPAGDPFEESCAHLVEVETDGAPSVTQDIMFGGPSGHSYSWPSIRTDSAGNVYVSLTHTEISIFAEAVVAGRLATDPLNTMNDSSLLRVGDVVHTSGRWGDYLGSAVDPSDPSCVWVVGEYAKESGSADWGTYIAATSYSGGCGAGGTTPTPTQPLAPTNTQPPTATPSYTPPASPTHTPTRTPTRTRTPTQATLTGDANKDGSVNAIDAALVLQHSAGLLPSINPAADANRSSAVDAIDAALILQLVAGLLDALP